MLFTMYFSGTKKLGPGDSDVMHRRKQPSAREYWVASSGEHLLLKSKNIAIVFMF